MAILLFYAAKYIIRKNQERIDEITRQRDELQKKVDEANQTLIETFEKLLKDEKNKS